MRADIETTSYFGQVATALELSPQQKDMAWSLMTKANVGRDDPTSVFFCILARFDGLTTNLLNGLKKSGGEVQTAVEKAARDAMTAMPEMLKAKLESQVEVISQRVSNKIAAAALETVDKEVSRRLAFRLGGFAVAALVLASILFGGGYVVGRDATTADAARWEALANSGDGGQWLALARMNNISSVLAQSCAVGEREVIAGGQRCNLPLFVAPPVANSEGFNTVRLSFAEWSNRLGVWGIFAVGAVGGWIVSRFMQARRQY